MAQPYLEDVFKRSGLPTYTFVEPAEFDHLKVALRTPGRGVVVEGPSGIGKTTAVLRALQDIGLRDRAQMFSGRNPDERELIAQIPFTQDAGVVVIDDFHRLDDDTKHHIADHLKVLADREELGTKSILIGINKAGDSLVTFAADLNNRIDTIHFEINDDDLVLELVEKGAKALNIQIVCSASLAKDAVGSFHIAQILCHELCLVSKITEAVDSFITISTSLDEIKGRVLSEFARTFFDRAIEFARGRRFRSAGRAPYLNLLHWLATSEDWTCSITHELARHPDIRGSVRQVVDKGYLDRFLNENANLRDLFHYDSYTRVLAVDDPNFMYFVRNLLWSKCVRQAGFVSIKFPSPYDFARSFAGERRELAAALRDSLREQEMEVFYDQDEQYRILGKDVEAYPPQFIAPRRATSWCC